MGLKLELHLHTISHGRVFIQPEELGERLRVSCLDGTAITNFFDISHAQWCRRNITDRLILVGQEVMTSQGHILAIGVEREVENFLEPEEAVGRIQQQGALAIAAHPFLWSGVGERAADLNVDAVETFNAAIGLWGPLNFLARRLAARAQKPGVAGTDTMDPKYLGRTYIELEGNDPREINAQIRAGRFRLRRRPLPLPVGFILKNLFYVKRIPVCLLHATPCIACGYSMAVRPFRYKSACMYCSRVVRSRVICSDGHVVCTACLVERTQSLKGGFSQTDASGLDNATP